MTAFNQLLAVKITNAVGTMWTAYLFTVLALLSLPAVLAQTGWGWVPHFPRAIITASLISLVAWIAQTFLQLVLLPIIAVGQNVHAAAVEQQINETHTASLAEFELAKTARDDTAAEIAAIKATTAELHTLVTELHRSRTGKETA